MLVQHGMDTDFGPCKPRLELAEGCIDYEGNIFL